MVPPPELTLLFVTAIVYGRKGARAKGKYPNVFAADGSDTVVLLRDVKDPTTIPNASVIVTV